MSRQLALDLPHEPALGRDNFVSGPSNAAALDALARWESWSNGKLFLSGPRGAGKTHLAAIWTAEVGAIRLQASALTIQDVGDLAERAQRFAIEDLDRDVGPETEQALFHLHNLVLPSGGRVLFTASCTPRALNLTLPDLGSRLLGAEAVRIEAPDDQLLALLLAKQFADRQLAPHSALIDYLVLRIERSYEAVRDTVARLDAGALDRKRNINIALARDVLPEIANRDS